MRAVRLIGSALVEGEAAQPTPGPGEILIRVYAAGVTPTELNWYPTTHTRDGAARPAAIPGHEFSGVVAEIGAGVERFEIGQAVYGMNDWFTDGALADYCVTKPASVAAKPVRLTHVEAATVPISALTAWQGLLDRAQLQPRDRVLVHGGAGAVGLFAVQLAVHHGADVIATVSAHNVEFVTQLGAAQVIDYRAGRFEDSVEPVDIVFDAAGGDTYDRSVGLLKPGGRIVTIASTEQDKPGFFIVEPRRDQLEAIAMLVDAAVLRPFVDAVVPFTETAAAFDGKSIVRRGRGKMVVDLADAATSAGSGGLP